MRVTDIVVAVLGLACLSACSNTPSQPEAFAREPLPGNSCAVSCPSDSVFSGSSGSVGCRTGFTPICQCTDQSRPMASCESIR